MPSYQRPRPRIEIVKRDGGQFVRTVGNDLLSLTVNKNVNQPAGNWNVSLAPRSKYLTEVKNGDWVKLYLDESDTPHTIGIVQRVARNRTTNNKGATTETVQINGLDCGAKLLKVVAVVDPFIGRLLEEAQFQQNFLLSYNKADLKTGFCRPHEIAEKLVTTYLRDQPQLQPPAGFFSNFGFATLEHGDATGDNATRGHVINLGQPNLNGNLWQIFKTYCHETFNEMYVDTDENAVPHFYIGERPYSKRAFADLHSVEVDGLGWAENLGKSASDARNWFRVFAEGLNEEVAMAGYVGYLVPSSIARHGVARLEMQTNAWADANLLENTQKADPGFLNELSGLLAEWYWNADEFVAGSITGPWRPDIRVGRRLDYRSRRTGERLAFYVEGVTHQFNFLRGMSATSLELTRGVPFTEDGGRVDYPTLRGIDELVSSGDVLSVKSLKSYPIAPDGSYNGGSIDGTKTVDAGV